MAADYLLDTSIVSDLIHDHRKVVSRVTVLSPAGRLFICSIVRGEVVYGLERLPHGRKRRELTERVLGILAVLPCEPVPVAAGDEYASFRRARERKGLTLDDNDVWIAATAMALDMVLVTRDADFVKLDGLLTEDWTR